MNQPVNQCPPSNLEAGQEVLSDATKALHHPAPNIDILSLANLAAYEGNKYLKEMHKKTRATFSDYSKALHQAASNIDVNKLRDEYGVILKEAAEAMIQRSVIPMNGFVPPKDQDLKGFLELVSIGSDTINRFIDTIEQIASSPKALYKLNENQFRDMLQASSAQYSTYYHNFSDILLGGHIVRSFGCNTFHTHKILNGYQLDVDFSKSSQYLALKKFMAVVMETDDRESYPRLELFLFEGHRGNKFDDKPTMKKIFFELGLVKK